MPLFFQLLPGCHEAGTCHDQHYSLSVLLYLENSYPFGRPNGHAGCGPSGDCSSSGCHSDHHRDDVILTQAGRQVLRPQTARARARDSVGESESYCQSRLACQLARAWSVAPAQAGHWHPASGSARLLRCPTAALADCQ